jgi:hypothetical protein
MVKYHHLSPNLQRLHQRLLQSLPLLMAIRRRQNLIPMHVLSPSFVNDSTVMFAISIREW